MNDFWYDQRDQRTRESAEKVLRCVFDIHSARSVVDIGCGIGTWLATAKRLGADTLLGIDGPHVPLDMLAIEATQFSSQDLITLSRIDGRYDLAIAMEVAEHLPPSRGEGFVKLLCSTSDVVLFSAAIPGQGGNGHINEQALSYWSKLFAAQGYTAYDFVRPIIWNDDAVMRWYRQNVMLFSKTDLSDRLCDVGYLRLPHSMIDLVHPEVYGKLVQSAQRPSSRRAFKLLAGALRRKILGDRPAT
jgi:SAM-dependent methyltransferase